MTGGSTGSSSGNGNTPPGDGTVGQQPEDWDDVEYELAWGHREVTSLHFGWPSATTMSGFRQVLNDRWSGNVGLPFFCADSGNNVHWRFNGAPSVGYAPILHAT